MPVLAAHYCGPDCVEAGAKILRDFFRKGAARVFVGDLVVDEGRFTVAFSDRPPHLLRNLFGRFKILHLSIGRDCLAGVLTQSAIDFAR